MVVKSCLKQASRPSSPQSTPATFESGSDEVKPMYAERRKSVSFRTEGDDEEEIKEDVFYAYEWDRSPMQVTRKLNYRDMLELMELRLSLPRIRIPGRQRSGSDSSSSTDSTDSFD